MLIAPTTHRSSSSVQAQAVQPKRTSVAISSWQAILSAYQQFGGLTGGDEVARQLRNQLTQPVSTLARWIVAGQVLTLPCESVLLLPLFQFDFGEARVRPAVLDPLMELRPVFDDWDLASWFATPNTLLDGASPMRALDLDPAAVLEAARIDRFIAAG